jgi:hypothetical protein
MNAKPLAGGAPSSQAAIIAAGLTLQHHDRTIAPPPSQITLSGFRNVRNEIALGQRIRTLVMQLVEGFRALT